MMKHFDSKYVDKGVADVALIHSVFRNNVTCDNIKRHIKSVLHPLFRKLKLTAFPSLFRVNLEVRDID